MDEVEELKKIIQELDAENKIIITLRQNIEMLEEKNQTLARELDNAHDRISKQNQ